MMLQQIADEITTLGPMITLFALPLALLTVILVAARRPCQPPFPEATGAAVVLTLLLLMPAASAGCMLFFGWALTTSDPWPSSPSDRWMVLTMNPSYWLLFLVSLGVLFALARRITSPGAVVVALATGHLAYWVTGVGLPDISTRPWGWTLVLIALCGVGGGVVAWATEGVRNDRSTLGQRIRNWALAGAGAALCGWALAILVLRSGNWQPQDATNTFYGDLRYAAVTVALGLGIALIPGSAVAWLLGLLRWRRRLTLSFIAASLLGILILGGSVQAVAQSEATPAKTTITPAHVLPSGEGPGGSVMVSPTGDLLAQFRDARDWQIPPTLIAWRTRDWTRVYSQVVTVDLPERGIPTLAFAPDGQTLAVGWGGGAIQLFTAATGRLSRTLSVPIRATDLQYHSVEPVFSRDGTLLAAAESAGQDIWIWSVADGMLLRTLPVAELYAGHLVFAPDGQTLALGLADGRVQLIHVGDGSVARVFAAPAPPTDWPGPSAEPWAFSPDGTLLMAAVAPYKAVIWRVADGSLVGAYYQRSAGLFTANGQQVISDGMVWRVSDGQVLYYLSCTEPQPGASDSLAPPGAQWVASANEGQICVWRLP